MSSTQTKILSIFILLNLIVYGVLGFLAFVDSPRSTLAKGGQAGDSARVTEVASEPVEVALAPTESPTLRPSDTPITRPTDQPTARPTDTPTLAPWQEGGSWWTTPTATPSPTPTRVFAAATPASKQASQQTVATITIAAPQAAAPSPSGDSPLNAIVAGDTWRNIGSGASVWYKIGKAGDHMEVFLEASPLQGVSMQVFAPGNLDRPIGQGSLERGRLVWAGGKWNSSSDWLARVTNNNPGTVSYRLTSSTREIGACDSWSYWEWIGKNLVYWTACR